MNEKKVIKKYISEIADKISIFYGDRKRVLQDMQQSVEAYVCENPEATYEELVQEFGEPETFANELMELDTDNSVRKNMIRSMVLMVVLVIVLALGILNVSDEFAELTMKYKSDKATQSQEVETKTQEQE